MCCQNIGHDTLGQGGGGRGGSLCFLRWPVWSWCLPPRDGYWPQGWPHRLAADMRAEWRRQTGGKNAAPTRRGGASGNLYLCSHWAPRLGPFSRLLLLPARLLATLSCLFLITTLRPTISLSSLSCFSSFPVRFPSVLEEAKPEREREREPARGPAWATMKKGASQACSTAAQEFKMTL